MSNDQILARLIMSTGRKKRELDLIQVKSDLDKMIASGYTKKQIAQVLGISVGMLNKFFSVEKLSSEVQKMIENKVIKSVALVNELAKFSKSDQIQVATLVNKHILTTHDVRALAPLRKIYSKETLESVVERLINSKDRKISVIRIPKENLTKDISEFVELLTQIIGKKNFENLVTNETSIDVKISKTGEVLLRKEAKANKMNLSELINYYIEL
jgi:predicted transcriptional regulator